MVVMSMPARSSHGNPLAMRAVQNEVQRLLIQLTDRDVEGEVILTAGAFEESEVVGFTRRAAEPGLDGAVAKSQLLVRNDHLGVDLLPITEARAGGAGAVGAVEREVARGQLA